MSDMSDDKPFDEHHVFFCMNVREGEGCRPSCGKHGAETAQKHAKKRIKELGAKPAFKGYHDYPCVLCTSVNQEIVHGIPSSKRVLKEGDIVSIDCGVVLDGYYSDAAITVPVGNHTPAELKSMAKKLHAAGAAAEKAAHEAGAKTAVRAPWLLYDFKHITDVQGWPLGPRDIRPYIYPPTALF